MKKIGLLFLTVGDVPHSVLWQQWLAGAEGRYAIFMHPKYPDQVFSPLFADKIIPNRVQINHGSVFPYNGDLGGHLAMLKEALLDTDIDKFVMLTESCMPIRPFDTVYETLTADAKSWLCHYPDAPPYPQGRFERLTQPSQSPIDHRYWFCSEFQSALTRPHAQILINQQPQYFDAFRTVPGACENYAPTMLAMAGVDLDAETTGYSCTFVDWTTGRPKNFPLLTGEDIDRLALSRHLFARKFPSACNLREWWPTLMAKGKAVMERAAT
jgi:hypothetical protein